MTTQKRDDLILIRESDPQTRVGFAAVEIVEALGGEDGKPTGDAWKVRVIRAGLSNNGNEYPLEVLHEAVGLFNGARVLLRTEEEHLANRNVSGENVVGWLENPTPVPEGIDATLKFTGKGKSRDIKESILAAWNMGKRDLVGLSIVAEAFAPIKKVGDRLVRRIEKIVRVKSVDIVVNPAAGGRFVDVSASDDPNAGGVLMDLTKILKVIESLDPASYKKLNLEKIVESEVIALATALLERQAQQIAEAQKPGAQAPAGATSVVTEAELGGIRKSLQDIAEAQAGLVEALAEARFNESFAGLFAESNLPASSRESVLRRVDKKDPTKIAEAIKAERSYLAEVAGFSGTGSAFMSAESIVDEADKLRAAMVGFFLGESISTDTLRLSESEDFDWGQKLSGTPVPRARSIRDLYIASTGDREVTGRTRDAKRIIRFVAEADLDAQWSLVLGDSIARAMQREYRLAPNQEWRKICDTVPVRDFRTQRRGQLGGFSKLAAVTKGNAYVDFTTIMDDFEATYAVAKYGNIQPVYLETIVNDDVGAIQRIPREIGRAAMRTVSELVWILITANGTIYDTNPLFDSANHGNYTASLALTLANVHTGRLAMMKQTRVTGSEKLNFPPKYLAHPVDLQQTAFELCYAAVKPTLSGTATTAAWTRDAEATPNFLRELGLEPLLIPHLTDTNDWFLIGDKGNLPLIEVGFLGGREEPEIWVNDAPTSGTMFTNDKVTYKVRTVVGAAVEDWRGFWGTINA